MFIVTLKAVASISQRDVPTIRGNCLNSASMSDHRCPQIVISFKLLSGEVHIYSIISCDYMGFIWSDLTVDGYNYTCTVYLGRLELLKKKKKETHTN